MTEYVKTSGASFLCVGANAAEVEHLQAAATHAI